MSFFGFCAQRGAPCMSRFAPLALLLVAACAGSNGALAPPPPTAFSSVATTEMFLAGYDSIQEYFIDPVKLSDVTTKGLNGLKSLEPSLAVERRSNLIEVAVGSSVVGTFPAPREDDTTAWARLTTSAIVAGRDSSNALADSRPERIYKAVFDAALSSLDRFSRYATAEAANDNRAARDGFGGIGVTLAREDDPRRIAAVLENTPAARAGLIVDDVFTHVDGQELGGMELNDLVRRLRGPVDSTLSVTVRRKDRNITVSLQRAFIVPPTVTYRREGDAAYFKLASFNQRTAQTLREHFNVARTEIGPRLNGVILDLRGNPGGLLDQAVSVSNLFVSDGEIVSIRGRHPNSRQHFDARRDDITRGLPLIVLVDHHSASAAEIVAAALQDSGRALVIGTRSYGKGTVQTVQRMPNGGEMTLTWARVYAPTGYPLQDFGVMPTVCTSFAGADSRMLMSAIRSSAPRVSDGTPRQQRMIPVDTAVREKLGKGCPARSGGGELEIQVARQLLEDPPLFARAMTLRLGDLTPEVAAATH